MVSYLLADNEQCKQLLLAQTSQDDDGTHSPASLLPFIANGICAMGMDTVGPNNGRVRD